MAHGTSRVTGTRVREAGEGMWVSILLVCEISIGPMSSVRRTTEVVRGWDCEKDPRMGNRVKECGRNNEIGTKCLQQFKWCKIIALLRKCRVRLYTACTKWHEFLLSSMGFPVPLPRAQCRGIDHDETIQFDTRSPNVRAELRKHSIYSTN